MRKSENLYHKGHPFDSPQTGSGQAADKGTRKIADYVSPPGVVVKLASWLKPQILKALSRL
jgi:hypothetical protein